MPKNDSQPESSSAHPDSSGDNAPRRRRDSRAGTRSVHTLSPAQLERKRANDREAQRTNRQRNREYIESLERQVSQLGVRDAQIEFLLQRNAALEAEVGRLRQQLLSTGYDYNPNEGSGFYSATANSTGQAIVPMPVTAVEPYPEHVSKIPSTGPDRRATFPELETANYQTWNSYPTTSSSTCGSVLSSELTQPTEPGYLDESFGQLSLRRGSSAAVSTFEGTGVVTGGSHLETSQSPTHFCPGGYSHHSSQESSMSNHEFQRADFTYGPSTS